MGPLQLGIFDLIQKYNIEHIYTKFPEGKIRRDNIEIGGKAGKVLENELDKKKVNISKDARYMLNNKDFTALKKKEKMRLIRLKVRDLGFGSGATTKEIYKRAEEFGLELCPAEVGPHYRLKYTDQPINEWFSIAMKQIIDRNDYPSVFSLGRDGGGLWLNRSWTRPGSPWSPDDELVFSIRKLET